MNGEQQFAKLDPPVEPASTGWSDWLGKRRKAEVDIHAQIDRAQAHGTSLRAISSDRATDAEGIAKTEKFADTAGSLIPFIGPAKDLTELGSGKSSISNEELSGGQQALTAVGLGLGGIAAALNKFGSILRATDEVAEATDAAADTARRADGFAEGKVITTPDAAARRQVQGEYRDPLTNEVIRTADHLAADHIFPKKLIERLPGFDRLTKSQKRSVLNNPVNFQGLPGSLNSSKGSKIDWSAYRGELLHPKYAKELGELQRRIKGQLQDQINEFLE